MVETFDLTIIGTGPGGYVAAIRAAQLGMKVAVVEKWPTFGGTCLNIGCIPSKALLHVSEMFAEARDRFDTLGIDIDGPRLNLDGMMEFKDDVVKSNTAGIEYLFKKNRIAVFRGLGSIAAPGRVLVTPETGKPQEIATSNIVIASGSVSMPLSGVEIDEERIVTSTGALSLDKVPEKFLVIGAGVIGLELGSVWARLGAEVTVVEFLDRILPGMDGEVAKGVQRLLGKQGFSFHLGTKVTGIETTETGLHAYIEPANGGDGNGIDCDVALIAVGRRPYTEGLGLEIAGVETDGRGFIKTDRHFRTSVESIYAIGDVIAGPMLAHRAEDEGVAVAELLAGQAVNLMAFLFGASLKFTRDFLQKVSINLDPVHLHARKHSNERHFNLFEEALQLLLLEPGSKELFKTQGYISVFPGIAERRVKVNLREVDLAFSLAAYILVGQGPVVQVFEGKVVKVVPAPGVKKV